MTLGTNFADVYLNDELFARELSYPVAVEFVTDPYGFQNAFVDHAKLRTYLIEKYI